MCRGCLFAKSKQNLHILALSHILAGLNEAAVITLLIWTSCLFNIDIFPLAESRRSALCSTDSFVLLLLLSPHPNCRRQMRCYTTWPRLWRCFWRRCGSGCLCCAELRRNKESQIRDSDSSSSSYCASVQKVVGQHMLASHNVLPLPCLQVFSGSDLRQVHAFPQ